MALLKQVTNYYTWETIIKDTVGNRHFRGPHSCGSAVQALANTSQPRALLSVHAVPPGSQGQEHQSVSAVNTLPSQCQHHHTNHIPKHRAVPQPTWKLGETICSIGQNYRQEKGELFSFLYGWHSWKTLRSETAVEGGSHCVTCIFYFAAVTFQIFKFLSRYFNFLQ